MIYYIYKVRRKQTSIRFSRSVLPHRYLRCISWISWNGHRPPQAGFPPSVATAPAAFCGGTPIPKAAIATLLPLPPPGGQANTPPIFPQNNPLPFSRTPLACRSSCAALSASSSRTAHDPSAAGPSPAPTSFLRPPHKQKKCGPAALRREPAHQKSVDFSLKKAHVGTPGLHALASAARTYSLTARIHYHPFSFLLFYKGKEKRKQKQIQQVRIHRSDSLRSSSRCTRLARRASSAEIYVAIATRFVRDCVEDLDLLTAQTERIPKCSWHIKDHYPGVIKASRISLLLLRFSFLLKFFPIKI